MAHSKFGLKTNTAQKLVYIDPLLQKALAP